MSTPVIINGPVITGGAVTINNHPPGSGGPSSGYPLEELDPVTGKPLQVPQHNHLDFHVDPSHQDITAKIVAANGQAKALKVNVMASVAAKVIDAWAVNGKNAKIARENETRRNENLTNGTAGKRTYSGYQTDPTTGGTIK